jgi:AcrR family transcriptional regulator
MAEPTTAAPRSLRAENTGRTRRRILDAVVRLVGERGNADFSMPEAAAASGVSLRTLYRYHPTRQRLIDAVATVGDQAAASNLPAAELVLTDLRPWLEQAWKNLLEQETFIRAQHTSPNGAAIRRARIPFFRDVTRTLLDREVPDLDASTRDDIVDTILLLVSSSAMFELLDVLEAPIERAAQLASDAVVVLIEARRAEGRSRGEQA